MKRYKLLKDLPCAGAGEIFQQGYDDNDKDSICLFQEIIGVKPIKILLEEIIENIIEKYYTGFEITDYNVKELPDLILGIKAYNEPIFNIFILELEDDVLKRLVDWSRYIRTTSRKNYILCPKNKEDEVKKYVGLMSGEISIETYNDKNEVEF